MAFSLAPLLMHSESVPARRVKRCVPPARLPPSSATARSRLRRAFCTAKPRSTATTHSRSSVYRVIAAATERGARLYLVAGCAAYATPRSVKVPSLLLRPQLVDHGYHA